jgi:hypothetical protein
MAKLGRFIDGKGLPDAGPPPRSPAKSGGTGKEREGDFKAWIEALGDITTGIGIASYNAQIVAAEAVANLLRNHLSQGVGDSRAEYSEFITGIKRPALSSLARHVIVERPKQMRATAGQFSKGFAPAVVTFHPAWQRIAFELEHGKYWEPNKNARLALKLQAQANGFQPAGDKVKVWVLPPRPFSHILVGPEAHQTVLDIATKAVAGDLDTSDGSDSTPDWKKYLDENESEFQEIQTVNIDDFTNVLADPHGTDWADLIDYD